MGIKLEEIYTIYDFLNKQTDILVLFGASTLGKKALEYTKKNNIKVDYFCDNDSSKNGSFIEGIEIISPSQLSVLKSSMSLRVLIASMYDKEIRQQLNTMGLTNIYSYNDIVINDIEAIDIHHCKRGQFNRELILNNEIKISMVRNLLEDSISKAVFDRLLKFRLTKDLSIVKSCRDEYEEYLDLDIVKFNNDEIIIDAGSFTGDTLQSFSKAVKYKKYYAFEPDQRNFVKLTENVKKMNAGDKVVSLNKGISNVNGFVAFQENEEERGSSAITDSGNTRIEVVRLDDCLPLDEKITFIKMDIEGAERDALEGCRNILLKHKPKLAICIYHRPDDLWEIPLMIKRMVPEYKLYIRHYSNYLWETVCYAT